MQRSDIEIPPYVAERPQRPGPDPAIKRMIIAAGVIAAALIAVTLIWTGIHPHFGPTPTIAPPSGPMRTAPANPGGLQVPGAQQQIMSGVAPTGPPKLAQGAEIPDFAKLNAEVAAARQKRAATQAPPKAPPATTHGPATASTEAIAPAGPPAASQALPLPPALPPELATAQTGSNVAPSNAAPSSTPATPAQPAPGMASSAGAHTVQFAALTSKKGAMTAWQHLTARVPGLFQGKTPVIVPGSVKGKTYYRLRIGGFATAGAAQDFCAKAKAKGISCYVPR